MHLKITLYHKLAIDSVTILATVWARPIAVAQVKNIYFG